MIPRLSSPLQDLQDHYDVVVVGSGYGGAIAASRLARAGRSVCLLERGKELRPGEYPDTVAEAVDNMQIDFPEGRVGSRTALYDMHVDDDINVVHGCGLGGTSLINANVSLRADPRIFDDPRWPQGLRDDVGTRLEEGYDRAEEMLKPNPLPERVSLNKLDALARSAAHVGGKFYRLPINVNFEDRVNHVGVEQQACKLCGDCVSGCNYGAKNTTLMNYLPDARNHGASIFTQVDVRSVERADSRWLVHFQPLDTGRERFDSPPMFVSADVVVLAAGTLGSTEILMRSAAGGLPLSPALGRGFTGNGDVLGFSYNSEFRVDGVGWGSQRPGQLPPVGPCITGAIDMRDAPDVETGMIVEEGSIPGALAPLLPIAMAATADAVGVDSDRGVGDQVKESARELESLVRGPYHGAVSNTQIYLVMAHDDAGGRLELEHDRVRVRWHGVGRAQLFDTISDTLAEATRPLGGTYLRNPLWTKILGDRLVTVHPLGGCVMAEDAAHGVVNHKCQVFAGSEGTDVHEGLYVSDGAVIPRPLGVNPLLTISAISERCCALIAKDRGWIIDYSLPSSPPAPPPPAKVGIEFTETMKGFISTHVDGVDFEEAERAGKEAGSPFSFILTIRSDDLDAMLADPQCEARMVGTVSAPALSPDPVTVTNGVFNLFVEDPEVPGGRRMRYRMQLTTEQGRRYWFTGFKLIHHDRPLDLWPDTTTLYITIHEGEDDTGPVAAKGVLHILPEDFSIQLGATRAVNAKDEKERLEAQARFGQFFAGKLFDTYGGIAVPLERFDPTAPPRKKRPLRVQAPEVHPFRTDDGVELMLTRFKGGPKGPVILSHGLGVSSKIFSIDTIDTNLLEFLYAHGYDVWLLDFRASIDLPSSNTRFDADDVARHDYPAAVAKVRSVTGAPSVQMVAHCFGSTTFFMAMLAGLQGVRSAVISQIATHVVAPPVTRLKSWLYLPTVLERLGINKLTAYTSTRANLPSRLYDRLLDIVPDDYEELCRSATCHRITFMYSLLYEHDQLDEATHDALHEMFGVSNIDALEHLALMVRKGELRDAKGRNVYLPHLDRLAIPMTFIHGAENACFLPRSTAKTLEVLRKANGPDLYQRYVVANYGHIDCILGKNAAQDIFPLVLKHLEATV